MNYACLEEMYADDAHQRLNFLMKAVIGFDWMVPTGVLGLQILL